MTILDHVGDVGGQELNRLALRYDFPDFVKNAALGSLKPAAPSPNVYAFPSQQLYPCHNKAATWLSTLYFTEKAAEFVPPVRKQIQNGLDAAIAYWGMKAATDAIKQRHEQLSKQSDDHLPDSAFGFVWQGENGRKERSMRLASAAEVKVAAEYLKQHRDALPFADRNVIAEKILVKAAEYAAALPPELDRFLEQQAGHGVCSPAEVADMLQKRAYLAKTDDARVHIIELAAAVQKEKTAALQPEMLVKLAGVVDALDRGVLGLTGHYTAELQPAEAVLFKATWREVTAAVAGSCQLTTGRIYDQDQFAQIKLADVQALFGDGLAREVAAGLDIDPEKMAQQAIAFPRPEAELFQSMLDQAGVKPIHKVAGDDGGLKPAELEKLAAAY